MGDLLGKSVKVNLDKYLAALEIFTDKAKVDELRQTLGKYGISGAIDVYSGPSETDGEVVLLYKPTESLPPYAITFGASGKIHERWLGASATVSEDVASLFVGGLFESEVADQTSGIEKQISNVLSSAASCWVVGETGSCDMSTLEKKMFNTYVQQGNAVYKVAEKLKELVVVEDEGWGGIDADPVRRIYDSANDSANNRDVPTNVSSARVRYESAVKLLRDMLENSDAMKVFKKRGSEIGCSIKEWSVPLACNITEAYGSTRYTRIKCDAGFDETEVYINECHHSHPQYELKPPPPSPRERISK